MKNTKQKQVLLAFLFTMFSASQSYSQLNPTSQTTPSVTSEVRNATSTPNFLTTAVANSSGKTYGIVVDFPASESYIKQGIWWAACAATYTAMGEVMQASGEKAQGQYLIEVGIGARSAAFMSVMMPRFEARDLDRVKEKWGPTWRSVDDWKAAHYNQITALLESEEFDDFLDILSKDLETCYAKADLQKAYVTAIRELTNM